MPQTSLPQTPELRRPDGADASLLAGRLRLSQEDLAFLASQFDRAAGEPLGYSEAELDALGRDFIEFFLTLREAAVHRAAQQRGSRARRASPQ